MKRTVLRQSAAQWYFHGKTINTVQENLEEITVMEKF